MPDERTATSGRGASRDESAVTLALNETETVGLRYAFAGEADELDRMAQDGSNPDAAQHRAEAAHIRHEVLPAIDGGSITWSRDGLREMLPESLHGAQLDNRWAVVEGIAAVLRRLEAA